MTRRLASLSRNGSTLLRRLLIAAASCVGLMVMGLVSACGSDTPSFHRDCTGQNGKEIFSGTISFEAGKIVRADEASRFYMAGGGSVEPSKRHYDPATTKEEVNPQGVAVKGESGYATFRFSEDGNSVRIATPGFPQYRIAFKGDRTGGQEVEASEDGAWLKLPASVAVTWQACTLVS